MQVVVSDPRSRASGVKAGAGRRISSPRLHERSAARVFPMITVPVGGADSITITFTEAVTVNQAHLTLFGQVDGPTQYVSTGFAPGTNSGTWEFPVFPADKMELTLADTVLDGAGNQLDGKFVSPADIFQATSDTLPSGDGTEGDDFVFHFTILPGDANRDNIVGLADLDIIETNFALGGSSFTFADGDFSGDGVIDNLNDYQPHFKPNFGKIWLSWETEDLLGDVNRDSDVNGLDVDPFVSVLLSGTYDPTADMNDDGEVNGLDVDFFVQAVLSGLQSLIPNQLG